MVFRRFSICFLVLFSSLLLNAQANAPSGKSNAVFLRDYGVTVDVPAGWTHHHFANADELLNVAPGRVQSLTAAQQEDTAKARFSKMSRADHAQALKRLQLVVGESTTPATFLVISGWPALQRQSLIAKPIAPEVGEEDHGEKLIHVTTAVAVDKSIIRVDAFIPAKAANSRKLAQDALTLGKSMRFTREGNEASASEELRGMKPTLSSGGANHMAPISAASSTTSVAPEAGLSTNLAMKNGEPEIAVSTNGKNIVIANQTQWVSSQDGGKTFSAPLSFGNSTGGDSSMAFGRSGNFYEGTIGTTNTSNDSQFVNISTNGGQTFPTAVSVFVCSSGGGSPNQCTFVSSTNAPNGVPDQEHIAADRFNAGSGGDQVYFVWRKPSGYSISCSQDSGANWTAAQYFGDGSADFPRIAVGQDGTVYVSYLNGNNVEVDRYGSCASGFAQQEQGAVVASGTTAVTCPVAGLDRCNNGNDLRSPTVAVDDLNAAHVYVAYVSNTASGNEDVFVADSTDHGDNWNTAAQVNNSIPGRRYSPWVCAVGGTAYASWYDRRNASSSSDDLTDYFAGSAAPNLLGNLTAGADFQINAPSTSDPQCASGWPGAPRSSQDSESCSTQPQLAGVCGTSNPLTPGDTKTRCDFNPDTCTTGPNGPETCQTGGGIPKYGDYNGSACAAGRLYSIFSSATPQPLTTAPAGINVFFSQKLVCCSPQIQVSPPAPITACAGSKVPVEVNVCNTGKADLEVDDISSSGSLITVQAPSSRYPLIISPDACFPVNLQVDPTGNGNFSGSITVASNDTVNPSLSIPISGTAPAPSINATIANTGSYGNVCAGNTSDLTLEVVNQSQCNLVVSNITSSGGANFALPTVSASLPLTIGPGGNVDLPVRFQPAAFGSAGYVTCDDTTAQTSQITISSNDPSRPTLTQQVSGIEGCPKLVLSPQQLTGANAFPATVSDPTQTLGCHSDKQITISNAGVCPLIVPSGGLSASPATYFSVVNPTLPLTIAPGTAAAPVTVRFRPLSTAGQSSTAPDQQLGSLSITSNDPVAGDNTAAGNGGLCGEPESHSGARVLVLNGANAPVNPVGTITLSSKGLNPNLNQKVSPAPLNSRTVCGNTVLYQFDNEALPPAGTTGSNPKASYAINAKNGSTQANISFTLGACELKQIILQEK